MDLTPTAILDKVRDLLRGEPARAIGYGAAVVIYLVALAFDRIPDMTLDAALVSATAAIVTVGSVIETIRRFVYSPVTVEVIAQTSAETGVPVVPPPPADKLNTPEDVAEAVADAEDGAAFEADTDVPAGNG